MTPSPTRPAVSDIAVVEDGLPDAAFWIAVLFAVMASG
jgi:hypothetical protein